MREVFANAFDGSIGGGLDVFFDPLGFVFGQFGFFDRFHDVAADVAHVNAAFFGEEQWSYYQQKASKYLKKKVKLGKSKNFKLGKEKQQLNCAIIAW